eukprot:CAMPEP_0117436996 /NCGR_PEP_ID=MMETSP0759-20121206/1295_1 /TAXON_ID=63605 /ORGANISM="Percolomonas cosmopolitus, Strain WS" /LENGTH=1253 /DNA_ID=CAMNT_0005228613 /DNA_START=160 /DNA_END=3921 /DNA_ORIENTATION=+
MAPLHPQDQPTLASLVNPLLFTPENEMENENFGNNEVERDHERLDAKGTTAMKDEGSRRKDMEQTTDGAPGIKENDVRQQPAGSADALSPTPSDTPPNPPENVATTSPQRQIKSRPPGAGLLHTPPSDATTTATFTGDTTSIPATPVNTPNSSSFVPSHTLPFDDSRPEKSEIEEFDPRASLDKEKQSSDHMKLEHERMFEKYKVLKTKVKLLEYDSKQTSSKKGIFKRRNSKKLQQKTALEKWKIEYDQLEKYYHESRDECVILKKDLINLQRSYQEIELDWKRDQTRAKFFESELDRLREKLKSGSQGTRFTEVVRERDRYRSQADKYKARVRAMEEQKNLLNKSHEKGSHEVDTLRTENKSLRQQLEAVHRQMDHRLDTIRSGTEKLIADINDTHNQELEVLKNLLNNDKEKMQQNEQLHQKIVNDLKHQVEQHQDQVAQMQADSTKQQQELHKSTNEFRARFEKEKASLETELQEQKELLEKWKQQCSQLEGLVSESSQSTEIHHSQEDHSSRAETSSQLVSSLKEETLSLKGSLREKEQQISELHSQVHSLDEERDQLGLQLKNQNEVHAADSQKRVQTALKTQRDEHERALSNARENSSKQIQTLKEQIDALSTEVEQKKHNISQLEARVHGSPSKQQLTTKDALFKELEKRNLATESQLHSTLEQVEKLRAERSALSQENGKLQHLLKEASVVQTSKSTSNNDYQKRINDLQQELILQERVLNISRELEAQKTAQIQKLEANLSQLESERRSTEKEVREMDNLAKDRIQTLSFELTTHRTEATKYQQQNLEAERNLVEQEKNVKTLTRQLDEVRQENEDTISRLNNKVDKLSAQLHEAKKLEFKLDEANASAERLKRQLDEKVQQLRDVERLERELKNQSLVVNSLEEEKKSNKLRTRRMESEIRELHAQVNSLRAASQDKTTHYENELLRRAQELSELQSKYDILAEEKLGETRAKKKLLDALAEVGGNSRQSIDDSLNFASNNQTHSPIASPSRCVSASSPLWQASPARGDHQNVSSYDSRAHIKEELNSVSLKVDNQVKEMKVKRLLTENRTLREKLSQMTTQLEKLRDDHERTVSEAQENNASEDDYLNTIEHLKEKINQQQDEYDHLMKFVTSKMDTDGIEKWIYSSLDKEADDWGFSRTREPPLVGNRLTSSGSSVTLKEDQLFSPTRFHVESRSNGVLFSSPKRTSQFQRFHAMTYPAPSPPVDNPPRASSVERRKSIERKYSKHVDDMSRSPMYNRRD